MIALTWLANELVGYGKFLQAGDLVKTGTCAVPIEVADAVSSDSGISGSVATQFIRGSFEIRPAGPRVRPALAYFPASVAVGEAVWQSS